jgi:glycosyltransferase involved in cell wall biosynthesis
VSTDSSLVSVVVPAHNAGKWIRDSVSSALNQSWRDLEVIVVDDGSTDNTVASLHDLNDSRLRVLRQAQRGASAARNRGFNESCGTLIQFLDADDILSPDKIELQVQALRDAPVASVASCSWKHLSTTGIEIDAGEKRAWAVRDPIEWLVQSLSGGGMMQPAGWLTPRSIVDRSGLWNESLTLHDDGDFFARVLAHASNNIFVPQAQVIYRDVPESLSRRRGRAAAESAFAVCLSRHEVIAAKRDDPSARRSIATQYAQFAYEFSYTAPDLTTKATRIIRSLHVRPAPIVGGPIFRAAARAFGFDAAMRIRRRSGRRN